MAKPSRPYFQVSSWMWILGSIFLAIGTYSAVQYVRYKSVAFQTEGTVVRVNSEHKRSGGRRGASIAIERPVVRFQTPEGIQTTAIAKVTGNTHRFVIGEKIAVDFDPRRPEDSLHVAGGPSWIDLGLGLLGLGMLASAATRSFRQRLDARNFGKPSEGSGMRSAPAGARG